MADDSDGEINRQTCEAEHDESAITGSSSAAGQYARDLILAVTRATAMRRVRRRRGSVMALLISARRRYALYRIYRHSFARPSGIFLHARSISHEAIAATETKLDAKR